MANNTTEKSVLFVCLGNICRSPMAEAILKHLVKARNYQDEWNIDSCGTARYHIGEQPDDRCIATLEKHEIHNFRSTVRQLTKVDFSVYRWIFVFDSDNKNGVERTKPSTSESQVILLRSYDTEKDGKSPTTIIDPYWYDDNSYFELCYEQCNRSLKNFLLKEHSR